MTAQGHDRRGTARNLGTGLVLTGLVAGMVGLAFASVPLYRLFCQVTGYGGTTQVAEAAPGAVDGRLITVRFNADVDPGLPWRFQPVERAVEVRIGEQELVYYRAANESDRPLTGTAVFNVTPQKVGPYFSKVACFCFDEQRLEPGQTVDMGVSFFIDPAILEDRNLDEVTTVTLSYTFFHAPEDEDGPAAAVLSPERPSPARRVTQRAAARLPATSMN